MARVSGLEVRASYNFGTQRIAVCTEVFLGSGSIRKSDMPSYFAIENDYCLRLYFRIPFTGYFVGKCRPDKEAPWSKLYLFTKEWIANGYSWVRVSGNTDI